MALAVLAGVSVLLAAGPATPGSDLVPATAGGSPSWLLGPLRELRLGSVLGARLGATFLAGLVVAVAAYAVVVWRARDLSLRTVATAVVGLHVLFALAPPLLSQDVFSYLAYARLGAVHGLDPYLSAPAAVPGDAVYGFAGSKGAPSVYGPGFTLGSYALAGVSPAVGLWSLKSLAAACSLAATGLVWRAAGDRGIDARAAVALVGLNPALLVHVVGGAHNEALLMLCTAAALATYGVGRRPAGAAIAAGATAIKASAVVLAPFLVAGARRHGRALVAGGAALAAAAAVVLLGLAGFGAGAFGWLDVLLANQARTSSFSLPYKTAELLGALAPGDRLDFREPVRIAYAAGAAAVAAALLLRAWRGADPIAMAGWATLAILLGSAWLVPWYIAWLLPLAAVGRSSALAVATVALTAWTLPVALPL